MNSVRFTQVYLGLFIAAIASTAVVAWLSTSISSNALIIGLAVAVTLLGLPHGALDFKVAKSLKLFTSFWSACIFIVFYMLIAAVSIGFWIAFPALGLGLFLCVSIYHFASDWREAAPMYARLCFASIVLCGPAVFYSMTLIELFGALLLTETQSSVIILLMRSLFAVTTAIFAVFFIYRVISKRYIKENSWRVAEYIALFTSSLVLTPLLHFGLYFCVLHSPKHMQDVGRELRLNFKQSLLISLPFVGLTILIGLGVFYWFASADLNTELLRWIFIGLFGLTMSHMFLISLWHRSISALSQ